MRKTAIAIRTPKTTTGTTTTIAGDIAGIIIVAIADIVINTLTS